MLTLIVALVAVLEGADPEGVVATARPLPSLDAAAPEAPELRAPVQEASAHGLSTDEQITRWLDSRDVTREQAFDEDAKAERRMRGYVEGGIGSGGYRAFGAGVSLPLGDAGEITLHYRQTENQAWPWRSGSFRRSRWDVRDTWLGSERGEPDPVIDGKTSTQLP